MYRFVEIHIREQQKYEKRIQASVDDAGSDLGIFLPR